MTLGTLFLVPVPLGHPDDITLRAIEVLQSVDYILGEERKPLLALLKREHIEKEFFLLNEHTEKEIIFQILSFLQKGKSCALVSDGGTPVLEDPGALLVRTVIDKNISVVPLPGANSIVPALVMSGLPTAQFVYGGLLPRDSTERVTALRNYQDEERTMVFLDAPYRLQPLLEDMVAVFGEHRPSALVFDLSLPTEDVWRGDLGFLLEKFRSNPQKRLYVVVVGGIHAPRFPV